MDNSQPQSHYTYHRIIALKLEDGFKKEEFVRGDSVEGVVVLALSFRFLLTHLEKTTIDRALIREAAWHVDLLQHEAHAITSSPKRDIFSYLKAFHDAREVFLKLLPKMDLAQ